MFRATVAERRAIFAENCAADFTTSVEYLVIHHDPGYCSGPGPGIHRPAEDRVGHVWSSPATAIRALRRGSCVYVAPAGRYRRGDVLCIYDGRDIAREIGCGPSAYLDLVELSTVFRAWVPSVSQAHCVSFLRANPTWRTIVEQASRPKYTPP